LPNHHIKKVQFSLTPLFFFHTVPVYKLYQYLSVIVAIFVILLTEKLLFYKVLNGQISWYPIA